MWGPDPISARRLRSLIVGLPPAGTAIARATGAEIPGWGNTEELLALIAELVDGSNRLFIQAHSKKGSPSPKPLEVRRPAERDARDPGSPATAPSPPRKRSATSEELRAWFGGRVRYTGSPQGTADADNGSPTLIP